MFHDAVGAFVAGERFALKALPLSDGGQPEKLIGE